MNNAGRQRADVAHERVPWGGDGRAELGFQESLVDHRMLWIAVAAIVGVSAVVVALSLLLG